MRCASCGADNPDGSSVCGSCHASLLPPPPPPPSPGRASRSDQIDDLVRETQRAAKELAVASARLSKRLAEHAKVAAKDPGGAAKKAADRIAKELESVGNDVERILRDL